MGSVIPRVRRRRTKLPYLLIFAAYAVFTFAFITIGLQPVRSAEAAYAEESSTADATLVIDAIGLSAPVTQSSLSNNNLSVPEQIAASYSNSPNKTLIFGHSSSVFQNLKNIQLSDTIFYNEKTYQVTDITEVKKTEISMADILAPSDTDTIVLMTCSGEKIPNTDGDHTHRLIVTAKAL